MSTSLTGKGQTALEFLIMITLVMVVLMSIVSVLSDKRTLINQQRINLQAASTADKAGYELDMALAMGSGYIHGFNLREGLGGQNYTLNVENGVIRIRWDERTVFSFTGADNVSGNITSGYNRIRNFNGQIRVLE